MNGPLPARDTSAADQAALRLQRALEWEATGQVSYGRKLTGAMVQIILLAPWLMSTQTIPARISRADLKRTAVTVFAPPMSSAHLPPSMSLAAAGFSKGIQREPPAATAPVLDVDLNTTQLEFADDVGEQLPEVVRQNRGMLALLEKQDLTFARYILQPPSWEAQEGIWNVSGKFHLIMTPPQRWAVFRRASELYGVDLNRYYACAIFDDVYRHCLKETIRSWVSSRAPGLMGRVFFARLAFAGDQPCGLKVLEVSRAPTAAH